MSRALGACLSILVLAGVLGGCGDAGLRTERPPHLQTSAVIWQCARSALVRPQALTIACADDGIALTDLRWSGWGAETARASGEIEENPCVPSCVASRQVEYPVRVSVSGLVIGDHHAAYSSVRILATGHHPAHTPGGSGSRWRRAGREDARDRGVGAPGGGRPRDPGDDRTAAGVVRVHGARGRRRPGGDRRVPERAAGRRAA